MFATHVARTKLADAGPQGVPVHDRRRHRSFDLAQTGRPVYGAMNSTSQQPYPSARWNWLRPACDKRTQARIVGFLRDRISPLENPRDLGEALSGAKLGNYWKYRVGDWRIICDLQDKRIVVRVLRVGNRREIYR